MKKHTPTDHNKPKTGTYLLVLENISTKSIEIGKLGSMTPQCGYYVYVGSAFGGGGIEPRVKRHLKQEKPLRWHIDYLRAHCSADQAFAHFSSTKQESIWVDRLLESSAYAIGFKGFGASDSPHPSHLFFSLNRPSLGELSAILKCDGLVPLSIPDDQQ